MNILLVNPPYVGGYKKLTIDLPQMGLAYLAGALRSKGHNVQIADLNLGKKELPARFKDFDLVGITSDTPRNPLALNIAQKAKQYKLPVVMGGPHVSFMPEETLQTGVVDYVVRGEGEYILQTLADHLEKNLELEEIPGLSYRLNGQIQHNPDSPETIMDISSLPYPARDLLPMQKYTGRLGKSKATSIIGSRGCPFNCSFCVASELFGVRWRPREPEDIVEELEYVKNKFGIRAFFFMDDNHTLKPDRVIRLCELINKRDLNISWWCCSRANTLVENEDMVQSMAESGLDMVFIGVESANQETLDHFNKKTTVDTSHKAIQTLKKYNVRTMASFILGNLEETEDMIKKTIHFARDLKPEIAQFSILTPYPGTQLYNKVRDRIFAQDWSLYDGLHATIQTPNVDPERLERLLKKAYINFYFNLPRVISHPFYNLRYLFQIPQLIKKEPNMTQL